jgi:hypothetical protein
VFGKLGFREKLRNRENNHYLCPKIGTQIFIMETIEKTSRQWNFSEEMKQKIDLSLQEVTDEEVIKIKSIDELHQFLDSI